MGLFNRKLRSDGQSAIVLRPGSIHSATVSRGRGKAQLLTLQSFDHHGGDDSKALRDSLDKDVARYPVSALLDYDDYQLLLVEAPDVRPEELRSAIRWRIKDLISFHVDDAVIDVIEIPDQRHQNRNRMMYAVVARASRVTGTAAMLEEAGLVLETVDIPEMALRNLAMLSEDESEGVALLHLDEHRSVITLSRGGNLYLARRWDSGAADLRDSNDAERTARLEDQVMLEIQRSLDYYDSHFPLGQVRALVLTPPTANIPGLHDFLTANISLPVHVLPLAKHVENGMNVNDSGELLALGAALRQEVKAL